MDYTDLTTDELRALIEYHCERYKYCAEELKDRNMTIYHDKLIRLVNELKRREEEEVLNGMVG